MSQGHLAACKSQILDLNLGMCVIRLGSFYTAWMPKASSQNLSMTQAGEGRGKMTFTEHLPCAMHDVHRFHSVNQVNVR